LENFGQVNKREAIAPVTEASRVTVSIEKRDRVYLMFVDERLIGAAASREQGLDFLKRRLEAIA